MKGLAFSFSLCLVLGTCRTPPSANRQAVRQVIEARNASIARWYAAGQVDSLASVFALDVWQMPPNNPPLVSRDSLRAFWANAVTWGRWNFTFHTEDVVASDSVAVERGQYTLTFAAAAHAPMPSAQDRGNYVVLWRQDPDGQWRVVWDAPVSVLPPPGTTAK